MDHISLEIVPLSDAAELTRFFGGPPILDSLEGGIGVVATRSDRTVGAALVIPGPADLGDNRFTLKRFRASPMLRESHQDKVRRAFLVGLPQLVADELGESVLIAAKVHALRPERNETFDRAGWSYGEVLRYKIGVPSARKIAAMWGEVV